MKTRWFLGLTIFPLSLIPLAAQAQDASIRELEQKLQERDNIILELVERIEALERRVGVEHIRAGAYKTPHEPQEQVTVAKTEKEQAEEPKSMPGAVVVREGEAERALERSLTRTGALLLSPGVIEIEPSLTYARKEDSSAQLFVSNNQFIAGDRKLNIDSLTAALDLRLGLPWDSQFEFGLPYRWRELESTNVIDLTPIDSSSVSGSGLGDIRVGLAKTLLRETLWLPDLIGRITWDSDSGESEDNGVSLGGGYDELRVGLTAIKRQDPIAFVTGLSYEHSFEKNHYQSGPVIAANFGSHIALSPETSMRFLFSGAYQDESEFSGGKIIGSDRTIAYFEVGGTTLLVRGTLLNLSFKIGLTEDADDFAILLSLPLRFDNWLY